MLAIAIALPVLATLAAAQVNQADLAGLEANFKGALLDPILPKFSPQGIITGSWPPNTTLTPGTNVPQAAANNFPELSVAPSGEATAFNPTAFYTAALVDAGNVNTNLSGPTQTLHWLINSLHVNTTTSPYKLNYLNGTTIVEYAGPAPPSGDGPHRYVFLLFNQPSDFAAPEGLNNRNTPVQNNFDLATYQTNAKLGDVVAANYFVVENGEVNPTLSLTATQAVNSSTISGYTGANPAATAVNPGPGTGQGQNQTGAGAGGNHTEGGAGASGAGSAGASGTGAHSSGASAAPTASTKPSSAGKIVPALGLVALLGAGVAALF
ncbi:Putative odorant-binding protein A5 [Vanrija pseudolonga]|uniref:Odorant-binding protein A5 n=1 Tax=Vanrija pseudolonga TaxID=143232 RepID=A0AAF1BKI2_9TREE|nr:Putative odorant-binding protein A5 [Vanrija pseudolonga]